MIFGFNFWYTSILLVILSIVLVKVGYMHDYLFFTGLPETIMELRKIRGLSLLKEKTFDLKHFDSDDFGLFEAVVSMNSPLIGKNVRESKFRGSYDAVIIAIHRSGQRIKEKIGDIVLNGGDTLLIVARRDFIRRWYHSRVAFFVADKIISSIGSFGIIGLLAGVYFITSFYTEIITNNAAAALLVPIVLSVANQTGTDPRLFLIAVAMGASASFATPIGYQTNLMVYGPGGYRFKDFLKVGIPMNIFIGAAATTIIYLLYY